MNILKIFGSWCNTVRARLEFRTSTLNYRLHARKYLEMKGVLSKDKNAHNEGVVDAMLDFTVYVLKKDSEFKEKLLKKHKEYVENIKKESFIEKA